MKKISFLLSVFLIVSSFGCYGCGENVQRPTMVFNLDYDDMLSLRKELKEGKAEIRNAYSQIIVMADSILKLSPHKVTDGNIPPTGDPHDFFTIGKYAFPNPDTPDGMPYKRKDGMVNPESQGDKYDLGRYQETIQRINVLSLAWFYSEDEKYAKKASAFLEVWFLNPETRMNPNFQCAAALPGTYNGMAIGIIFSVVLIDFLDHIQLLTLSDSWTTANNDSLKGWFKDYNNWLLTSKFGIEESKAINNHGSWYSAQVAAFAIYYGDIELAKQMIDKGKVQIAELIVVNQEGYIDGSMPHELKRNQSFLYSLYGLESFCALAGCGKAINYDLWSFETKEGQGLKLAFDFITPFLLEKKIWTHESLRDPKELMGSSLLMLRQGAKAFRTAELVAAQNHILSLYVKEDHAKYLVSKNFSKH